MTTVPAAVSGATREAVARRTEELFRTAGALQEGHFALTSGRHGDRYLEKFQVLQYPAAVTELCSFAVARAQAAAGSSPVTLVAGPTTGGVILSFEAARQLGVRGIFAEEVRDPVTGSRREFRRGFRIERAERVFLVDDILTTGGSLLAMLPAIEAAGAEIVLALVLVDRSGGKRTLVSPASGREYPLDALWSLDIPTFEPGTSSCPGCAAGLPLQAPGSSAKSGSGAGPAGAA